MAKTQKFDDVKQADKVTPSATARPIIVNNHSMMAKDPMMAPASSAGDAQPTDEPAAPASGAMAHEKTIAPLNPISVEPDENKGEKPDEPKESEVEVKVDSEEQPTEAAKMDTPESAPVTSEPKPESQETEPEVAPDKPRDSAAEMAAEETAAAEAKTKREQELEAIITGGKYAVPIDAVQRRRSRIATGMLVVLAVLLAFLLIDVILDVGVVHVPSSVPHTHFFSKE